MIDKNIMYVAVKSSLYQHINDEQGLNIDNTTIKDLAGDITEQVVKKITDFQLITVNLDKEFDFDPRDVLGEQELECFRRFATMKGKTPEVLLRHCILQYCPIETMMEQLSSQT